MITQKQHSDLLRAINTFGTARAKRAACTDRLAVPLLDRELDEVETVLHAMLKTLTTVETNVFGGIPQKELHTMALASGFTVHKTITGLVTYNGRLENVEALTARRREFRTENVEEAMKQSGFKQTHKCCPVKDKYCISDTYKGELASFAKIFLQLHEKK